ncbi:hypothetical protein BDN71DRAFT_192201 [Pleurotus eryngii]|uniref:Uncharacterized protein n=1 Tax=Pleurotus eryngii TaxID=5323 RepID=A0A9P6DC78_PLEER|nr:hypothetical protein BDN71DRAFT_192201 [Pleurotus eryngii]
MDIGSYASSPTKAVSDARCPDITTHRALLSPQTWTFGRPLVRSCFKASPPTLPPPHFPPLFDIRFCVAPRISCACEQGLTPPESQITLIYVRLPSPRFSFIAVSYPPLPLHLCVISRNTEVLPLKPGIRRRLQPTYLPRRIGDPNSRLVLPALTIHLFARHQL